MYRYSVDNAVTYLPSDITLFRESPFAAWMERLALENPDHGIPPDINSQPPSDIAQRQDDLVDTLRAEGRDVVLVDWELDESERRADTLDAMRSGADFIVNGVLALGALSGNVNMLMRTSGFSELGDFLYIPCDTQGGKGLEAGFRLAFFADLLHSLQGQLPPQLLVIYPDAEVVPLQTDDHIHYYRAVKKRFFAAMDSFRKHRMPDPAESSHFGRWSECAAEVLKQRAQSAEHQRDAESTAGQPDNREQAEPAAASASGKAAQEHAEAQTAETAAEEAAEQQAAEQQADADYAVAEMPVAAVADQPPLRDAGRPVLQRQVGAAAVALDSNARPSRGGLTLVEQARSLSPDAYRSRKAPGRTPNLAHFPVQDSAPAARATRPAEKRDTAEVLENLEFIGSSQPAPLYDSRPLRPAVSRQQPGRDAPLPSGFPTAEVTSDDAGPRFDSVPAPSPSLREIPVPEPIIEGYEIEMIDLETYDRHRREPLLLPPDYSTAGGRAEPRPGGAPESRFGRESVVDMDSPQGGARKPANGTERPAGADYSEFTGVEPRPPFGSSLITNKDFDSDD